MATKNKGGKSSGRSRPEAMPQLVEAIEVQTLFSPWSNHYAHLSQAMDRHRLQVYSVDAANAMGRLVADYVIPNSTCHSMSWAKVSIAPSGKQGDSKRRKNKKNSAGSRGDDGSDDEESQSQVEVLALGLTSGSVHLFSPVHGKVIRILGDPSVSASSTTSSISSLSFLSPLLYASTTGGYVAAWNIEEVPKQFNSVIHPVWKMQAQDDERTALDRILVLSSNVVACAHHSIKLYTVSDKTIKASYPGHASSITHLVSIPGNASRFASAAKGDRTVNVWQSPLDGQKNITRPLSTLTLEAPVRQMNAFLDTSGRSVLLVISTDGQARLFEVPSPAAESNAGKPRKSTGAQLLRELTHISTQENSIILDGTIDEGESVRVSRLGKKQKVAFESGRLVDENGSYTQQTKLQRSSAGSGQTEEEMGGAPSLQRYQEAGLTSSSHNQGVASGIGANGMFTTPEDVEGLGDDQANVDVQLEDLEEPSLGQRLRGLKGSRAAGEESDENDDGDSEDGQDNALPNGSLSLGETLTQALHSNDSAMLSSCLAYSDASIIRLSVNRLSGPLALRLLEHCIDLMGRGGKRSRGQLSSARARGILEWIRATLTAHTGYLMSLPNLVHRLSALHATLSNRLAAHERILALNGRLELVLSQIELRAAYTAEQAARVQGVKTKGRNSKQATGQKSASKPRTKEWVEESEEEEDATSAGMMDVDDEDDEALDDVEEGDEEGDVQDISLGNETFANTSVDSEEEDDDDDDEEEEESDESLLDEEGDSDDVVSLNRYCLVGTYPLWVCRMKKKKKRTPTKEAAAFLMMKQKVPMEMRARTSDSRTSLNGSRAHLNDCCTHSIDSRTHWSHPRTHASV